METFVSVIIPVYNVEFYLNDCIESVRRQSLKNIEIICIDDCSTDKSLHILKKSKELDSRLHIVQLEKNHGQSYARNKGINLAKGKYLYFLDSDDMIEENALEVLYDEAETYQLDGIFFDGKIKFETDELAKKFVNYKIVRNAIYEGIYSGQDLFSAFINNGEWSASPPRQFWNNKFIRNNNLKFKEGIIHEDELFSVIALLNADRTQYLKRNLFIRRFRENSTMTKILSKKNFEGLFVCYCEIFLFWLKNEFNYETNKAIKKHILNLYFSLKNKYQNIEWENDFSFILKHSIINQYLFEIFNMENSNLKNHIDINNEKINIIRHYKDIIVYGAGVMARKVLMNFDKEDIFIYGFMVSNKDENSTSIMGNKVYQIDELLSLKNKSLVIVAVGKKYQLEVLQNLKEKGFKNVLVI